MQSNSTTIRNASIKEAVHSLRNDLLDGDIAARSDALRTADIASHYHFTRNDEETFLTASGRPVQLAMDMTEVHTGTVRTVIVRIEEGRWVWLVENMAGSPVAAWDLIHCVKQRIGAKAAGFLEGPVN